MVFDRMAEDQSSWPRIRIGDVAQVYDGPHATPTKTATGPIFLGISALNRGRLDLANTEHLSEEDFSKWTKRVVPSASDVVFSYETRIGEAAIIPKGLRCCLGRRMGLVRVDASRLDPHFFLYQYLSPTFQGFLHSRTIHGSTVDRIALKDFPDFEIDLPPLTVQRQIAKVMLDLDAKIDLNRRINQTLEAMAQAIFKSWFVDFDPVKAKIAAIEQGENPLRAAMRAISGKTDAELDQMPREHHAQLAATAALFPDEMQDSELGEIPKGWKVKPLSEFLTIKRGGSPRPIQEFMAPKGLPWVKIADATAEASPFLFRTKEFIKETGLKKTVYLQSGSLILTNSATPGLPKFLELDACIHDGWLYFPEKKLFSDQYLYLLFQTIRAELVAQGNGSVFTNLKTDILKAQRVIAPSELIMKAFTAAVKPMFLGIRAKTVERQQMSELRDTLLPKLLSGELSVADVEIPA